MIHKIQNYGLICIFHQKCKRSLILRHIITLTNNKFPRQRQPILWVTIFFLFTDFVYISVDCSVFLFIYFVCLVIFTAIFFILNYQVEYNTGFCYMTKNLLNGSIPVPTVIFPPYFFHMFIQQWVSYTNILYILEIVSMAAIM